MGIVHDKLPSGLQHIPHDRINPRVGKYHYIRLSGLLAGVLTILRR